MKQISKKNFYMLSLLVVSLLMIVIVPTYAKFGSDYETDNDIVGMSLSFDINISNIEEYEELIIQAGETKKFNVEVTNSTGGLIYYGIWYRMVEPSTISSDISIGRLYGSTTTTSGSIANGGVTTPTIVITNNSSSQIKLNIGVGNSATSVSDIEYLDGKQLVNGEVKIYPNSPNLDTGLIPVYYHDGVWKKADSTNTDESWYNYDEKKWANAVLVSDETKRNTYLSSSTVVGSTIADSDITAFYVWIPRYKYRVWNITRQGGAETTYAYSAFTKGIDIEWENGTSSTGNVSCRYETSTSVTSTVLSDKCSYEGIEITTGSGNKNYTNAWYTHPAFTFGDKPIEGFWIGKFETSGSTTSPKILPDVKSISQAVSGKITASQKFHDYGLSNDIDAHVLTNLEWGAVAYLTHSIYGLCSGESCGGVYINNSSDYFTGRSGGAIGGSSDLNLTTVYGSSNTTSTTKYNTTGYYTYKGYFIEYDGTINTTVDKLDESKIASTTRNVTGVYDMAGGRSEGVMGNMVDEFNANKDIKVFLISLKAGGTGLNLTGADMVIHYDPWWNASAENQATDRAYRIGQKNNVQVYILITKNSIEEKIYELQQKKSQLIDNMLDTKTSFISKLSKEDIMKLFE